MTMREGLDAGVLDLEPVAPLTGPFPRRPFLGPWAEHRGVTPTVVDHGDAAVVLWDDDGVTRFAGEPDLTDYHSPLGTGVEALAASLPGLLGPGTRLVLDSLPEEAARPLAAGLTGAGVEPTMEQHEVAAVLALGDTHDDYLAGLDKKQRHEVRRKGRRFAEAYGEPVLERDAGRLGLFVDMHRAAPGDKGDFMTDDMVIFFEALLDAGFGLDLLVGGDGTVVAAGVGYEDDDAYYLYNSAFDPEAGHASPGVILVDSLIAQAIDGGRRRFDFLKGDEVYKFRLGAEERPLYVVEAAW
ncbi:MAG: GNAT family N-acetyltransferase [Acidimicrobiia bacterium]|nr:GNAT family N-acetyltransferase [Acidimicrobiia bacterium]